MTDMFYVIVEPLFNLIVHDKGWDGLCNNYARKCNNVGHPDSNVVHQLLHIMHVIPLLNKSCLSEVKKRGIHSIWTAVVSYHGMIGKRVAGKRSSFNLEGIPKALHIMPDKDCHRPVTHAWGVEETSPNDAFWFIEDVAAITNDPSKCTQLDRARCNDVDQRLSPSIHTWIAHVRAYYARFYELSSDHFFRCANNRCKRMFFTYTREAPDQRLHYDCDCPVTVYDILNLKSCELKTFCLHASNRKSVCKESRFCTSSCFQGYVSEMRRHLKCEDLLLECVVKQNKTKKERITSELHMALRRNEAYARIAGCVESVSACQTKYESHDAFKQVRKQDFVKLRRQLVRLLNVDVALLTASATVAQTHKYKSLKLFLPGRDEGWRTTNHQNAYIGASAVHVLNQNHKKFGPVPVTRLLKRELEQPHFVLSVKQAATSLFC